MKQYFRRFALPGKLLLSAALGIVSVAAKPYDLFYLSAPALTAGAGAPQISAHALVLGQFLSCISIGNLALMPVLLLIYFLRFLFARKKKTLPPPALSCIMSGYAVVIYFFDKQSGIDLLLGICNALLSGCALFFAGNLKGLPRRPKPWELCNLLTVAIALMMACSCPALSDLPLYTLALLFILFCGRLPMWQGALCGTLLSAAASLIALRSSALPVFLSAAAAVVVMARFGKKRYTASALLCSELALLPTGLWLEQLLWLLVPPLAAGIYMLIPAPVTNTTPQKQLKDQYREMVDQVDRLQQAAGQRIAFYPEIAARAATLLREAGADNIHTTCAKDLLGGFFLDVTYERGKMPLPPSALLGLMERAGGFALAASKYYEEDKRVFACFVRRPPLTVKCVALCKTKEGETVCGDSAVAFSADQSHYILLLSDGMGSGKDAFAQSRWTVTLLQKLLRAGMNAEGAIDMVHSSLKLAHEEIAFATADLCSIDLTTGRARFLKAGAVSTFILREDHITEVYGISMPLGAPDNPDVAARSEQLRENDLILLISDGAYERKDEILYTMQRNRNKPLQQLAHDLLGCALEEGGLARDDITVLLARICKNQEEPYEYRKE
ncbi:MAG: SpoIIE family protein phosphatase [Clostridia bacterium]|nr:SpoIIE family protein phosphatase [Clostridia bacterium]